MFLSWRINFRNSIHFDLVVEELSGSRRTPRNSSMTLTGISSARSLLYGNRRIEKLRVRSRSPHLAKHETIKRSLRDQKLIMTKP